jgi:N-acetylglucosamine-6-phosphate deacetylase
MTSLAVRGRRLAGASADQHASGVTVLVDEGRIHSIVEGHPPTGSRFVVGDGTDVIAPGLIDIHTHGAVGVQAIDGDAAALSRMAQFYATRGVTGFLGTIGGSNHHIESGLRGLGALMAADGPTGATCLGVHLEGPFISRCCPGAFRPESIVTPDLATFQRYVAIADGALALITIAPEVDGQLDVIRAARALNIVCSAGHSAATEAQMMAAIDHGVGSLTHMFNAMAPLHHREPGIVGVGLTEPSLCTELIADGVHVHPRMARLLVMTKGVRGIALITDSISAAGLPDGEYDAEEQHIHVVDGEARLSDGTLAGSTLTMDVAVRNLAHFGGISWDDALVAATSTPAALLGLHRRKGSVAVGFDADLVGFDDRHEVRWTMVGGDVVHMAGSR